MVLYRRVKSLLFKKTYLPVSPGPEVKARLCHTNYIFLEQVRGNGAEPAVLLAHLFCKFFEVSCCILPLEIRAIILLC